MNKSIIEDICFNNESLFEQVELSEEYKKRSKIAYKIKSKQNDALN